MNRIAALDLLRGLAAFSVAVPHYLVLASFAPDTSEAISVLGVEVFFVLSGFVLAPQILACVAGQRPGDLGVFLARRWMRTIPPYLVALVAMSLLADALISRDFLRYAFYVQNLFGQHNARDYYPVAWSLSVEEWFYVTFPALLFGAARWTGRRGTRFCTVLACAFIALITVTRVLFGDLDHWGENVRRVVAFRIDSIAYGFLLYLLLRHVRFEGVRRKWKLGGAALLLVATALLAFATVLAIAADGGNVAKHLFPFCAAGFGMSAIYLFCRLNPLLETRLLTKFAVYMGRISYSVYLFHLMIGMAVHTALGGVAILAQLLAYLVCVIAFTTVFFRYFEKPILAARPHYRDAEETRFTAEAAAKHEHAVT
jgi:peptidoglycan/LPS O-acetylase OafA/YrhL